MEKQPSDKAETLAKQLQEKLRRERPRWIRWAPLMAMVLLGTLAAFAWLVLHPAPDPPPLTLTALDTLAVAGESALLRAYLNPVHDPEGPVALTNLEVYFDPVADATDAATKIATDSNGLAALTLERGLRTKGRFQVRQQSLTRKNRLTDGAQLHVLEKDSSLLLVDVEETLADFDVALWPKTNIQNIAVRGGAAKALRAVHAAKSFGIVYLATSQSPAREYRRVRGWVTNHFQELPDGPVLGRLRYDGTNAAEARQELLRDLRERFTGPMTAVVRTAEAAEQCLTQGIRAIAMGGGDFPDQVTRVKGWDELPRALAR